MLRDFGFGEVQVHLHALVEQFRRLGGIAEEQLAHHAVGGEFVQVTAADADHITAWSKGDATDRANCEMLCKSHNRAKGNR